MRSIGVASRVSGPGKSRGNEFFDPRKPEMPEETLGVDTDALLRLGRAVTDLGILPPGANLALYKLPDALRLMPLLEQIQSGAETGSEDVRPYRKPIKRLVGGLGAIDKLSFVAGDLAVGVPLRRAFNSRIEREFPEGASGALSQARERVESVREEIENGVRDLSGFDNPRQQFVEEINTLGQMVAAATLEQRDVRIRDGSKFKGNEGLEYKGLAGAFMKLVGKIRSFFGLFRRKDKGEAEVTAYDAGSGIEKTILRLISNKNDIRDRLPMISKLVLGKLPKDFDLGRITRDHLSLAAPEILNFLFSVSEYDEAAAKLIQDVERNPHELRFVTKFKRRYGKYSLDRIQQASFNLFPAIRDVLPTNGEGVNELYSKIENLLGHKRDDSIKTKESWPTKDKPGVAARIRNFIKFKKRKK
jgi:hypothetical protein